MTTEDEKRSEEIWMRAIVFGCEALSLSGYGPVSARVYEDSVIAFLLAYSSTEYGSPAELLSSARDKAAIFLYSQKTPLAALGDPNSTFSTSQT